MLFLVLLSVIFSRFYCVVTMLQLTSCVFTLWLYVYHCTVLQFLRNKLHLWRLLADSSMLPVHHLINNCEQIHGISTAVYFRTDTEGQKNGKKQPSGRRWVKLRLSLSDASCHWGIWGTCPPDGVAALVNSLQNRVKSITLCVILNAKMGNSPCDAMHSDWMALL